jgi:hypothetical protein
VEIYRSCVNSVDICIDCGADHLFCAEQIGLSPTLVNSKGEWIGIIQCYSPYLGGDHVIHNFIIYENKSMSDEMNEKYGGKILIFSEYIDYIL